MSSVFNSPNPMLFGCGTSKMTGEKLTEFGCKKVLVVFDRGIKASGIIDVIINSVKASGIDTVMFDKVEADAPDYLVNEAGALGLAENVDGIVAVGGGSTLDTAKGVRVLLTNPGPINNYFVTIGAPPPVEQGMKPLIVIPTTAGTGSEATPGGIILDTALHVKRPIACSVSLAIMDPEMTIGLPPEITAVTGIDALCHAAEAMTSKAHNRISEALAKEAITLIGRSLPTACTEGTNIEARENMLLAATLAGMSLRGPFGGIPHDIGTCAGTKYSIPHGTAVGLFLPEALKYIAPAIPEKVKLVVECLGVTSSDNEAPEVIGDLARDCVRQLYKKVNFPALKDFVQNKQEMLDNVDQLFRNMSFSPRTLTREAVLEILANTYDAS